MVHFIDFNNKVRRFNELKMGTKLTEVYLLLGNPSYTFLGLQDERTNRIEYKGKKYIEIVYDGIWFVRKDLILDFDMDSEELIYKERKMRLVINDVIYENMF